MKLRLNDIFQGTKEVNQEQIRKILGLNIGRPGGNFSAVGATGAAPGGAPQYAMPQGPPGQLPMAGPRGPAPGGLPGAGLPQAMPLHQPQPQGAQQPGQTAMPSNKFLQVSISNPWIILFSKT